MVQCFNIPFRVSYLGDLQQLMKAVPSVKFTENPTPQPIEEMTRISYEGDVLEIRWMEKIYVGLGWDQPSKPIKKKESWLTRFMGEWW